MNKLGTAVFHNYLWKPFFVSQNHWPCTYLHGNVEKEMIGADERHDSRRSSNCRKMRRQKNEGRLNWKPILETLSVDIRLAIIERPTSERLNPLQPLTAPPLV